jgi:hypothetical protein
VAENSNGEQLKKLGPVLAVSAFIMLAIGLFGRFMTRR